MSNLYKVDADGKLKYEKVNNVEYYLKNSSGDDKYILTDINNEIYAFNFQKKSEIYAKDRDNQPFYAQRYKNEIYAVDLKERFELFIVRNRKEVYAKNHNNRQIYPENLTRKQKIARENIDNDNSYYYALLENGDAYYPTDEYGDQYIQWVNRKMMIAVTKNGLPIAPKYSNGRVKYNKDKYQREILYKFNDKWFFGKDFSNSEVYCRDEFQNEYYFQGLIAKNSSGELKYAISNENFIIYPKDEKDNEYYLSDKDTYSLLKTQIHHFERYVVGSYPQKQTDYGLTEMIINNTYNKTETNQLFYPKDSFNNEHTNKAGDIIKSVGYPVTNDGYIILPNVNNQPVGEKHLKSRITCLLYRPDFDSYDFLTNIKTSRHFESKQYHTLNIPNTSGNNYVVISIFILLIIVVFIIFSLLGK